MLDIGGNHAAVALQYRLHTKATHEQMVAACKAGARSEPAIVHRAAEAADIRHIGPGVVGGAGDKILTLHVGIAERVQEPPPDLLLRRDIKHEVDPVHSEPVELAFPL